MYFQISFRFWCTKAKITPALAGYGWLASILFPMNPKLVCSTDEQWVWFTITKLKKLISLALHAFCHKWNLVCSADKHWLWWTQCKNGCWINFLVFKLKLAWLASLEVRYSLEFCTLKNTASKANFNWNKRILTQQSFLHWVYSWPQNWRSLSLHTSMYLVPRWCLCLFIANSLCSPFSNLMKASPFLLPWAFKQKAIPPLE